MTNIPIVVPDDLILQLRKLIPKRRLTYGQSRIIAQIQALRLRKLLGKLPTRLPLDWIERIPNVSVTLLTGDEMEELTKSPGASGATDIRKDGSYRIYINERARGRPLCGQPADAKEPGQACLGLTHTGSG